MVKGRPVCFAQVGDLMQVAAIYIASVNLHIRWLYKSFAEKIYVFCFFLFGLRARSAKNKFFRIGREKCASIVTQTRGDLALVVAIDVHDPEF